MKKMLIILIVVAVLLIVGIGIKKKEALTTVAPTTHCYVRSVAATTDAPYAVEEEITITIDGTIVTGTKSGTQSGPDMTNGYQGTLSGTKTGDAVSLLFAYVIEGSAQSEQEEYVLSDTALTKHRYPLIEQAGVLVPDTTKGFISQEYSEVDC